MIDLVFICYSRKDEAFVLKLAKDLKNKGVSVWLDKWDIPSGANWNEAIDKALNDCASMVLVLTPSSVESERVQHEWSSALDKKKVVVPILYQLCDIPSHLSDIQYIDFTQGPGYKASLEKLLNTVGPDAEMRQSRVWSSKAIKGRWDGSGKWDLEDKTWKGSGIWEGGLLIGTWQANGTWSSLGDSSGEWKAEGEFICNMEFMMRAENYVIILGSFISILVSAFSYFIGKFGNSVTIMTFLLMIAFTILAIRYTRSTTRGKARLNGTWRDVGEFRILDINGYAELGNNQGVISGKMSDPIPR
jgi:hypothetical protein